MSSAKWLFAALLLVVPALGAAAPNPPDRLPSKASPSPSRTPRRDIAPADRYFGQMQMSPIGLRGQIGILSRNYTWRMMSDDQLVHDAEFIKNALDDWRVKFPGDPWLAPTAFHLAQFYAEIQTDDARRHAIDMFRYTAQNFPKTTYAHLSRVRLQQGFPPLHEETPLRPSPTPTPSPTPVPTETPTASPSPTPTETPTPSPTPSPSPTPTPQPRRGRHRQRSTPTPSPSPSPSPTPSPSPSATPTA